MLAADTRQEQVCVRPSRCEELREREQSAVQGRLYSRARPVRQSRSEQSVVSGTQTRADGRMLLAVWLTIFTGQTSASLIVESPQSTQVMLGSPVSLPCRLDSSLRVKIVWYKDGGPLDTRNSLHRLLTLPDGSLFFLSSEVADSGEYQCQVRDQGEQVLELSRPATLTVLREGQEEQEQEQEHHSELSPVTVQTESKPEVASSPKQMGNQLEDGEILMEIEATTVEKEGGVVTTKTEIPLVFWIICLSVVSFMTVLVIFGAGFVIFKIKMMKQGGSLAQTSLEAGDSLYERPAANRRSWLETPWNFYPTSAQLKTFTNQKLLSPTSPGSPGTNSNSSNSSSDYDYASSDYFLLSNVSGDKSPHYLYNSRHYASTSINK